LEGQGGEFDFTYTKSAQVKNPTLSHKPRQAWGTLKVYCESRTVALLVFLP